MITIILVFLITLVVVAYLLKGEKRSGKYAVIPGPKKNESNAFDVQDYKNQNEYLGTLHQKYGPIVSFWEGNKLSVSIASPELLKETRNLNYVTMESKEPFRYLLGDHCLPLVSAEEAKERRKLYDPFFMLKAVNTYFNIMKEIADACINKWKSFTPNDHIPIVDTANYVATKSILRTCFGDYFADDEKLSSFRKDYEIAANALGVTMKPGSDEEKQVNNANNRIREIVKKILDARKEELKQGADSHLFIDELLENATSEGQKQCDGLTFFIGSDSASTFLIWVMYELAKDSRLQEKIYDEIQSVVEDRSIIREDLSKLKFLRQLIDETLRYYSNFHTGRVADKDMVIGKYFIPKGTNIYQHLGVSLKDSSYWKDPEKFDPDHFNPENSKGRSPFVFKPFGCSGKRICPGTSYTYILISSFIAIWIQNFKMQLVPGQKIGLTKGLAVKPSDEIWITVTPRIQVTHL